LRRSTSASYYAVFHALALALAEQLVPLATADDRYRLARSVDHARVADVCRWVVGEGEGKQHVRPIVRRLRDSTDLVDLARVFLELQQARHDADYDHLAEVLEVATMAHHRQAVQALGIVERVRQTSDGQEFLALVALHTALR
jgi:hypothetical protein